MFLIPLLHKAPKRYNLWKDDRQSDTSTPN